MTDWVDDDSLSTEDTVGEPTVTYGQLARARVQAFMDANYPCDCGDADCPGNYYEAGEIVRIVEEVYGLNDD